MKRIAGIMLVVMCTVVVGASSVTAQDITAEGRAEDRQARIEEYKQSVIDRRTEAEQTRIASICTNAQGIVERLTTNLDVVLDTRQRTYSSIADSLVNLSDRIEAAGVDTTVLDGYISQMQQDAQALGAAVLAYQQVLRDMTGMDCEADIEGFLAALSVAREQRAELKDSATAIATYIRETIRPELENLKEQLVAASASSDEEGDQ